ncbi:MAG: DUF3576 domain-containing protein [Proteobacteria bacterium]|nr:DUF3576 domain-containing protein [Pseudomonadota bacterium]
MLRRLLTIRGARHLALVAGGLVLLGACEDPLGFHALRTGGKVAGADAELATGTADQTIGINAYLWRASLDTFAFMPLNSADPAGGVIVTDWYAPAEAPDERFKANIYITDTAFHANSFRLTLFRQGRDMTGSWVDLPTHEETIRLLESRILERASELRAADKAGG